MSEDDTEDEDYEVGYGRPPKHTRFKKGKSGCPDGGHDKRRANKQQRQQKEKHEQESIGQKIIDHFTAMHRVKINGVDQDLTMLEVALKQLAEDALVKRDPAARKLLLEIGQKNGWFKAPPPGKAESGVLVVYAPQTMEQWTKATEGELLPKNPLEGIPGCENWDEVKKGRGKSAD